MSFLENTFFKPDRDMHTEYKYNFTVEDYYLTSIGHQIHGQLLKCNGIKKGLIIQFHGNDKNISSHITHIDWLPKHGYDVFIFDYSGYGQSKGSVNRKVATQNGIDVLQFAHQFAESKPCFVLGQSLGASMACAALAVTQYKVNGLILDSAFPSFRKIAQHTINKNTQNKLYSLIIPLLISKHFDIENTLPRISSRILVLHGTLDNIVPFRF